MGKKKPDENQPSRKIRAYVSLMFDSIPYSEEVSKAQKKIEAVLFAKFSEIKGDRSEDEALEDLLGQYGRLSQMAELAGYPADSAEKWRSDGEAVSLRPLRKEILMQRIRAILAALFVALALLQVFWLCYHIVAKPSAIIGTLIVIAIQLLIASFPFRKYLKTEKAAEGRKYDTDAFQFLRARSDRFSKRLLNSIALLFAMIFVFLVSQLIFYVK